jgi:hypothetical protein
MPHGGHRCPQCSRPACWCHSPGKIIHITACAQTVVPWREYLIQWLTVKLSPSSDTLYWLYCSTMHCTRLSYSCMVASVHHCFRFPSLSYRRPAAVAAAQVTLKHQLTEQQPKLNNLFT